MLSERTESEEIKVLTIRTPPGEMKIPLPMIEPTMTVTPLRRLILGFSSIVESSLTSLFSSSTSLRGTLL